MIALPNTRKLEVDALYINSSVRAFVEILWRWRSALCALRRQAYDEDDRLFDNLATFKSLVHRIDPIVANDPVYRWWNGIVGNF